MTTTDYNCIIAHNIMYKTGISILYGRKYATYRTRTVIFFFLLNTHLNISAKLICRYPTLTSGLPEQTVSTCHLFAIYERCFAETLTVIIYY